GGGGHDAVAVDGRAAHAIVGGGAHPVARGHGDSRVGRRFLPRYHSQSRASGRRFTPMTSLFWSALFAFIAMPGVVAFLVPWLLRPTDAPLHLVGMPVLAIGAAGLLWCVRDFYVAGQGSLAPWAPPKNLVIVGLYRLSRNPMYVAVLTILCGWALTFASRGLWAYAACFAVAFHLRVVLFEEPWLARTHGAAWDEYRARVPRWLFPRP